MKTFDISIAQDAVAVKQGEEASLKFTVTNVSGRDLRALVKLVPENDEHMAWLQIDGKSRREVENAQSDSIVVKIRPPQEAPPGAGTFRLVVANEENPDEDFAEAVARFTVEPAPQAPAPEPRPRRWVIATAAGAVVAVAVIAVLLWPRPPRKITVPHVIGMTFPKAKSTLEGQGFRHVTKRSQLSSDVAGTVCAQAPEPDDEVPGDEEIVLNVAVPPIPMPIPEVIGKTFKQAKRTLNDAGVSQVRKHPARGTGVDEVQAQVPPAETVVAEDTEIHLFMRQGWIEFKNEGPENQEFNVVFKLRFEQDGVPTFWVSHPNPDDPEDPYTDPGYEETYYFGGQTADEIEVWANLERPGEGSEQVFDKEYRDGPPNRTFIVGGTLEAPWSRVEQPEPPPEQGAG